MASLTESLSAIARQFERLAFSGSLGAGDRQPPATASNSAGASRGVINNALSEFPEGIVSSGSNLLPESLGGGGGETAVGGNFSAERLVQSLLGKSGSSSSPLGGLLGGALSGLDGGSLSSLQGFASQASGGVLGGPLGLVASALLSLFQRDREAQSFPLYAQPDSQSVEFDIGRDFGPRDGQSQSGRPQASDSAGWSEAPSIVIQVNALDSRSFADHRDDIASAVREALTRNHALRDEIWEE